MTSPLAALQRRIQGYLYPSPDAHKDGTLGYRPNYLVKAIRCVARAFIFIFRLNKNNRLAVEIQQMLSPELKVALPQGGSLVFSTGHGRLVWRAKTLLTEEPEIIRWIDSFDSADVFFDVGANVGCYALYAARTKGIKVYAIEPEINNVQVLYANIFRNGLNSLCTPVPVACDRVTSVRPFYIREFSKGGAINTIGRQSMFQESTPNLFIQDTLCMRLDELVKVFSTLRPTKLKIDVDMNELNVIEGMGDLLDDVKEIYIELYMPFEEHQTVKAILERRGFEVAESAKAKAPKKFEAMANYVFRKSGAASSKGDRSERV